MGDIIYNNNSCAHLMQQSADDIERFETYINAARAARLSCVPPGHPTVVVVVVRSGFGAERNIRRLKRIVTVPYIRVCTIHVREYIVHYM